ncbi:MAG: aminopeptidase PepB [Pasteurellaceae bacterium]|nr:aminopeptidase PepB [Pasteurellaceae bacterium]
MQVMISTQPASESWGKNAILSFNDEQAVIHLKQDHSDLNVVQKVARKLRGQGIHQAKLVGENWDLATSWAFYQGFYSAKQDFNVDFAQLNPQDQSELSARIGCGKFVREIINLPAEVITPEELAHRAAGFIVAQAEQKQLKNAVSYHIVARDELRERGYLGIWTVGRGSAHSPAMLQLDFNPTGNPDAPVLACLVGKGITFDSGGYSIKPSSGMDSMRSDMGGAALLTGALGLAIARGLNQRVKLYLCCAENMISSRAFKLGDIIEYRNGVRAEIMNTDAEGRLVLADGLIDADKQKPQLIIDAATLTGAAKVAVGNDYHSLLSMDDQLVAEFLTAANQEHEPFWRLPFAELHRGQISSSFADISNTASIAVAAGASTATAFLSYFVNDYAKNWLHIDASATFRKTPNELWATGATGIGVQTIANFLIQKGA